MKPKLFNLILLDSLCNFNCLQISVKAKWLNSKKNKENSWRRIEILFEKNFDKKSLHKKFWSICWILVVQRSSMWLSEYILISLDFLFSSKLIIMKESCVSITFLIISESSLRRKFSKISHGAETRDNIIIYSSFMKVFMDIYLENCCQIKNFTK